MSNGSRPIRPTGLPNVTAVVVEAGADVADDWIATRVGPADICVTADIPLAARCLARGAASLSPTGHRWTADNIGGALAGRDVSRHLRELGVRTGGPSPLTRRDRAAFLVALDAAIVASRRPHPPANRPFPSSG